MFYEEKLIDGVLYRRGTPDGEWLVVPIEKLGQRVVIADAFRATVADKPFNPDWSKLEATQQSLRDHMELVNAAQESEQRFRAEVAAALGELQSVWHRRMNSAEDKVMESALRDVLDELNAAARALGIQEAGE